MTGAAVAAKEERVATAPASEQASAYPRSRSVKAMRTPSAMEKVGTVEAAVVAVVEAVVEAVATVQEVVATVQEAEEVMMGREAVHAMAEEKGLAKEAMATEVKASVRHSRRTGRAMVWVSEAPLDTLGVVGTLPPAIWLQLPEALAERKGTSLPRRAVSRQGGRCTIAG